MSSSAESAPQRSPDTSPNANLKARNRAVLIVLVALIALIFTVTIVKIKIVGARAVATPETPYGHASGEPVPSAGEAAQ